MIWIKDKDVSADQSFFAEVVRGEAMDKSFHTVCITSIETAQIKMLRGAADRGRSVTPNKEQEVLGDGEIIKIMLQRQSEDQISGKRQGAEIEGREERDMDDYVIMDLFSGTGKGRDEVEKMMRGDRPVGVICAENDIAIRKLVSFQRGYDYMGTQWARDKKGVPALYVKEVWDIVKASAL